jgi:hypothetical protein
MKYLFPVLVLSLSLHALPALAEEEFSSSQPLSLFEEPLTDEWKSNNENIPAFEAELDPSKVKQGSSSGKWTAEGKSNPWLFLKQCPTDWSSYEALSFWLFSENANGQIVNITVNSDSGYYLSQVHVDWQGWQHVIIPFEEFKTPRKTEGWDNISSFMISLKGYGQEEPLTDTVLYFDDLKLVRR